MSETPEMVERVARALRERRRAYSLLERGFELDPWGDGSIPRANGIVFEARAAIEAMREPTDAMTYVGQSMRHDTANSIGSIHRAMIDAALSKPTSSTA